MLLFWKIVSKQSAVEFLPNQHATQLSSNTSQLCVAPCSQCTRLFWLIRSSQKPGGRYNVVSYSCDTRKPHHKLPLDEINEIRRNAADSLWGNLLL